MLNFSGSLVSAPPVFFAGLGQGRALGCRLEPHTAAAFENAALWLGDGGEVVFKWVSFPGLLSFTPTALCFGG